MSKTEYELSPVEREAIELVKQRTGAKELFFHLAVYVARSREGYVCEPDLGGEEACAAWMEASHLGHYDLSGWKVRAMPVQKSRFINPPPPSALALYAWFASERPLDRSEVPPNWRDGAVTYELMDDCLLFWGRPPQAFFSDEQCRELEDFYPGSPAEHTASGIEQWFRRAQELPRWRELHRLSGGDLKVARRLYEGRAKSPAPPSFLVDGLIPRGYVTILVGGRKTGKSTLTTELAAVAGAGGGEWCGFKVLPEACEGLSLLLAGEDGDDMIAARLEAMDPDEQAFRLMPHAQEGRPLADVLAEYEQAEVSLLVVDPARKFLKGNEDESEHVNDLMTRLEDFARRKRCAVILVHHIRKDAQPRSLNEIPLAARGSSVFLDRPRVILGLVRSGDETILGIPAPQGTPLTNLPTSMMYLGQRRLRRDPNTFRHISPDAAVKRAGATAEPEAVEAVLRAVARLTSEGAKVTRTGQAGIFELRPDELAGLPRAKVRAAVDMLVNEGRLLVGEGNTLSQMRDNAVAFLD
ncbi:AAA family ATPase [Caenispirillum bisanense]|nr:AAA family ATPase [Caenispirillum bisanense]